LRSFGISISVAVLIYRLLKTESHMAYGFRAIRHVIIDNLYMGRLTEGQLPQWDSKAPILRIAEAQSARTA
jgi:hypothetical protein